MKDAARFGSARERIAKGLHRARRLLPWLRWGAVAVLVTVLVLDLAFPPPLPKTRDTSTLVVARLG